jgi:hypothetical protein
MKAAAPHEDALRSLLGHGRQELLTGALSEFLGGIGSQRIIETSLLVTAARLYVGAPVYADGLELPPCVENPPALAPPSGAAALKRLGVERDELTQRWRAEQRRWRGKAILPSDWLIEFFPTPAWGYLDALVLDGPDVAVHRLHAALEWEGERRLPGSRIREEGSRPALGYLVNLQSASRRFMQILSVRARAADRPDELSHWALPLPPSPLITTGRRKVTRRAPTLPLVRQVWVIHRDYVLERAGATGLNELPAAIEFATGRRVREIGQRRFRDFVILTLFVITAGRLGAIHRLRVGDVRFDYAPAGEAVTAAAIALRPGKRLAQDEVRMKILPPEAAAIMRAWLAFIEHHYGSPLKPEHPLLPSHLSSANPMGYGGLEKALAGDPYREGKDGGGRLPIVPPSAAALVRPRASLSPSDYHGFAPHTLRRLADQTARVAGKQWCRANPDASVDADDMAELLLDHDLAHKDPYGYAGITSVEGRERYSAIAIAGIWRLLTTEDGARRILDEDALRAAYELRGVLREELEAVQREVDAGNQHLLTLAASSRTRRGGREAGLEEIIRRQAETQILQQRERRLRDRLEELAAEIVAIRTDPSRLRVLPDDEAYVQELDPDLIELDVSGTKLIRGIRYRRVREWLTVEEFARWYGISSSRIASWRKNGLPYLPGDPRRPWENDSWAIDETWGRNRNRVMINKLKASAIRSPEMRDQLDILLSQWPDRWTDQDSSAGVRRPAQGP